MEKPSWTFNNVSYFNCIKQLNGNNIIIFSDFEHNWDLFQFMNNKNDYILDYLKITNQILILI